MNTSPLHFTRRTFLQGIPVTAAGCLALAGGSVFADMEPVVARIDAAPQAHPLVPALRMAHEAQRAINEVADYTCIFSKQERIGRRLVSSRMNLKLRHDPFSVYLKFIEPHAGRQVLYVTGRYDNNLLVKETGLAGLVGALSLDPKGRMAMEENRHPVTEIGMKFMINTVVDEWLQQTGLDGVVVNYYPNARVSGVACKAIEVTIAEPNNSGAFYRRRLYIESEHQLPIRVENFGAPPQRGGNPQLIEDYQYTEVAINVGLGNSDFDRNNREYGF